MPDSSSPPTLATRPDLVPADLPDPVPTPLPPDLLVSLSALHDRPALLQDFHRSRCGPIEVGPGHGAAREARAEKERREAVRDREQQALVARLAGRRTEPASLRASGPRAVLVHRAPWLRESLCRELERAGVHVVEVHEDGAAGLGSVVAEQPDLVLVQQQLPWRDGLDVVRQVRQYAPDAQVAVHLDHPDAERDAREAGAHLVFRRTTRPADMVPALVALSSS